jgi:hypothetical protein
MSAIIKLRSQAPQSAPQGNTSLLSLAQIFARNQAMDMSGFYEFFTTPSVERERFFVALKTEVLKADETSIIVSKTHNS